MRAIRELCAQMASEHPEWGCSRIQGALADLGHTSGRSTIRRILKDHGLEPALRQSGRASAPSYERRRSGEPQSQIEKSDKARIVSMSFGRVIALIARSSDIRECAIAASLIAG